MRSPKRLFIALIILALAIVLASGCAALGAAARTVVEPPRVDFDTLSLEALDLEGITLGLNWNVDNPNRFPFRLSKLGWALELDGRHAARGDTVKSIDVPAAGKAAVEIPVRLRELKQEWDIERAIEANASALALTGTALGATQDRRWLILPVLVTAFLFQHAIQGWCPPVPILRRLGFRTAHEIEQERTALMALRGDFDQIAGAQDKPGAALAEVEL